MVGNLLVWIKYNRKKLFKKKNNCDFSYDGKSAGCEIIKFFCSSCRGGRRILQSLDGIPTLLKCAFVSFNLIKSSDRKDVLVLHKT